jgi:hypothetical protein
MVTGAQPAGARRRFPDFNLPDLDGRRWHRGELKETEHAVVFCFASW